MTNPKRCLPGFVKCLKFALEYNFKLICMSSSPFMIWFLLMFPASTTTRSWTLHSIKAEFVSQDMVPLWTLYWHISPPLHGTTHQANLRHFERCLHTSKRPTLMPPPRLGNYSWTLTQWCWFVSLPVSNCYMGVPRLSKTHCCSSSISSVSTHSRYLGIFWWNKLKLSIWYISNVLRIHIILQTK